MTCPGCGTAIHPEHDRCPACGRELRGGAWPSQAPAERSVEHGEVLPPGAGGPGTGYAGFPASTYQGPPVSNRHSVRGIVLGLLAVGFCPVFLGPWGVYSALQGRKRGESLATVALVVAIVGTVAGIALGVWAATQAVQTDKIGT